MNQFVINLKRNVVENPLVAVGVAVGVITVTAKLIDAVAHHKGSAAYAKQINNRSKNSSK